MWHIRWHKLVLEEDFKKFSVSQKELILKNIQKKLSLDPQGYGKPLGGELAGYWRLRVEDYRVIYSLERAEVTVFVVKVGVRRDAEVYKDMLKRLHALN